MSQPNNAAAAVYAGQLCRDGATIYYLHTPQGEYIERPTLEAIAEEVRRHIPGRSCDECGRYVADGYADHDGGAYCSLVCAGWDDAAAYEAAWEDYYEGGESGDEPSTFWTTWEEPEEGWTPPPPRLATPKPAPAYNEAAPLHARVFELEELAAQCAAAGLGRELDEASAQEVDELLEDLTDAERDEALSAFWARYEYEGGAR
jgi:hypothetical protein